MHDESIATLEARLAQLPPDAEHAVERVDVLIELASSVRELEQWDRMRALASEARQLSETVGYTLGIAKCYAVTGFVNYITSELHAAMADCTEGLRLAGEDPQVEGSLRVVLAMVHWTLGNFDEGLRSAARGLELSRKSGDWIIEGFGYTVRGGIFQSLGDYKEALETFKQALAIFRRTQYAVGLMRSYSGLGSAHQALGELGQAEVYHKLSLETAEQSGHKIGIARALSDLGEIAFARGDTAAALAYHDRAYKIRHREGHRQPETTTLLNFGRVYRKLGEPERAIEYLKTGLAIAGEIGARPKTVQLHHLLSQIYEDLGDHSSALKHYKLYEQVKANLSAEQSLIKQKALELESELESAKKDAEIHRLRNVELAEALDQLQKAQAELINSEKLAALGSLVAALAHEINSPLGVIRSAADVTLRCAAKPGAESAEELLRTNAQLISDAAARIHMLIARLKNVAGLDQAEYKRVDLHKILDEAVALLEPEFEGRITVPRIYGEVPPIYAYAAELYQVFMHLLRNAIQAIEGAGCVTIRTRTDDRSIYLEFQDTGRGIAPEMLPRLFNPGFTSRDRRVQASLSLFTCLTIVKRHDGELKVASRPGEGATFTVVLPRELQYRADANSGAAAAKA